MKALIAAASAAAVAALVPAAAQAQVVSPTGAYGNLGYSRVDADDLGLDALGARLGYRFNNWLGVEGEGAFGVGEDTLNVGGVDVDVKLKRAFAAYAVGFLPLSENTDLLARVGYGTSKIKGSTGGVSASASDESWNFGVGAQHHFDGLNGVRVDYTRQEFDKGDGDANVWSIAYTRRF